MYTRQYIQRKTPSNSSSTPAHTSLFRQRPFNDEANQAVVPPQQQEMPDLQTQLERAKRFGHNFSQVQVLPDTPSSAIQPKLTVGAPGDKYEQEADSVASQVMSMAAHGNQQPIQREMAPEEEQESVQAKPLAASITPLIQREMAPEQQEEEPVQAKPLSGTLQRETAPEQEEEPVQAKSLSGTLQRETAPAQEEEPVQAKPLSGTLQRETAPEQEEDPVQAKPLSGTLQRETAPAQEEEEPVQAKRSPQESEASHNDASENLENQLNSSKGGGSPLPDDVRSFMEPRFGADFSSVRVHTDTQAVQMNQTVGAQAFTHGSDIYFGSGKSPTDLQLTAHELTHVVQQTGAKTVGSQEAEANSRSEAQKVQSVSRSVIQRDDTKVDTQDQSVVISLLEKNRPAVETARANALARVAKIVKLQGDGNRAIGLLKGRLLNVADGYDQAYNQYAQVIAAARQEARNQQEITDIIVGIAIGVAVGLAAEGVAACAVVGAAGKVAARAVGKWGAKAVGEAVGEGVEAAGGKGAKGHTEVAGQDLQPDGLKPEVLRMEIWKSLTKLHESLSKTGEGILDQTLLMGAAEYALGEIKSQKGGGADMTPNEDVDLVLGVLAADKQSQPLDRELDNASQKIAALESGVAKMPNYNVTQMEKDIWILWMSTLQKDCNILDLDAIEDHLKALGIVDFGWYTTDDEENEAIEKAKQQATEVRKRRNQAMGTGSAGQ